MDRWYHEFIAHRDLSKRLLQENLDLRALLRGLSNEGCFLLSCTNNHRWHLQGVGLISHAYPSVNPKTFAKKCGGFNDYNIESVYGHTTFSDGLFDEQYAIAKIKGDH